MHEPKNPIIHPIVASPPCDWQFYKFCKNVMFIEGYYKCECAFSVVRRYPPNPRGTKNLFSDIRVLSIQIYVLSLSCLAMGINLVRDKGPRD